MTETVPIEKKLLLSLSEACALLGIGRTTLYELIAAGELQTKLVGRKDSRRKRRMIRRADLESFCKK